MPRNYSRIQQYEKEILRLKEDGYTKREIGENLGFSYEQIHNFIRGVFLCCPYNLGRCSFFSLEGFKFTTVL